VGDLVLDDVGASVPARVDDHLRVAEVGKRVERDVLRAPVSSEERDGDGGDDEAAVVRREGDDLPDHFFSPRGFDESDSRAAFNRDSESTRNAARTTTCSPCFTPESTSTVSPARSPVFTARGWNRPSPTATKTTLRSPESMIESAGTRRPSCGRAWKT